MKQFLLEWMFGFWIKSMPFNKFLMPICFRSPQTRLCLYVCPRSSLSPNLGKIVRSLLSPVLIIDLEWQDSRSSWNRSEYDFESIELPGSSIWLPYFKIGAIVNEVDLKLRLVSAYFSNDLSTSFDLKMKPKRDEVYRIDCQGQVTGKFQKFVNGYCLIYPYFYPYDRHICLVSIFYRTDFSHSYTIQRWSVSSTANLFHPRWDIIGSLVQLRFQRLH